MERIRCEQIKCEYRDSTADFLVEVGAHEIRIKTEVLANNRPVQSEDKIVRIQVRARGSLLSSGLLVFLLVGIVVGVVVVGTRISRRWGL